MLRACGFLLFVLAAGLPPALSAQQVPSKNVEPSAQLQLRVYQGFNAFGPAYPFRDTPMAIDVTAGLIACPDGNTEISTLNIGGWLYAVPEVCADARQRGSIHVGGSAQPGTITTGTAGHARPATAPVTRCDPATWNCSRAAP
jgi:hypothetical protein